MECVYDKMHFWNCHPDQRGGIDNSEKALNFEFLRITKLILNYFSMRTSSFEHKVFGV